MITDTKNSFLYGNFWFWEHVLKRVKWWFGADENMEKRESQNTWLRRLKKRKRSELLLSPMMINSCSSFHPGEVCGVSAHQHDWQLLLFFYFFFVWHCSLKIFKTNRRKKAWKSPNLPSQVCNNAKQKQCKRPENISFFNFLFRV